ncbi:hypothetical protein [Nocardia nova]|uniref:hypothetical protein n=1 Tax=Nocardia nova TaxID=37330 RepID=UPI0018942CD6|nr:hypothetical protein [Nocardia nova]MBF6277012.1 hypothetical protein [Nocardia nova]
MISDDAIAEVRALEEARRAERVAEWKRATNRDELDAILREHINYRDHDHRRAVEAVIDKGWRPPPRRIDTAEDIAQEQTGTVIRSRNGDIGSVDHGPHGEWTGPATVVHLLDLGGGMGLSVADLADPELASTFPYTVLHEPETRR